MGDKHQRVSVNAWSKTVHKKRFPLYSIFIRDLGVNGNVKSLYIVNISTVVIFS